MKKTVLVFVMFIVMIAMVWAGGRSGDAGGKMQLTYWNLGNREPGMEAVIQAFMRANPDIEIRASYYDTDGIKDAKKVAAASRTLPDMWYNWGGTLGSFYAENNLAYDLTVYARTNGWHEKFNPAALSLCTMGGKLTGYPTTLNALVMYYNRDIFSRLNLSVPTTFQQFEQLCTTLRQNGITPISVAGHRGWHAMRILEQLIEHHAGPAQHDRMSSFQASYNHGSVVQALTKFQEWSNRGFFPEGWVSADPNGTYIDLFAGRAAMDIQGPWYDGTIGREGQNASQFGVFPFPNGGNNRLSAFVEMTQFNANLSPQRLEACVKFMDYYTSNENFLMYPDFIRRPPRNDAPFPPAQVNLPIVLDFAGRNGTFTITDQAFPTEVADELFRVQDGLAIGSVTPRDGAARIQAAIEAWKRNNP